MKYDFTNKQVKGFVYMYMKSNKDPIPTPQQTQSVNMTQCHGFNILIFYLKSQSLSLIIQPVSLW